MQSLFSRFTTNVATQKSERQHFNDVNNDNITLTPEQKRSDCTVNISCTDAGVIITKIKEKLEEAKKAMVDVETELAKLDTAVSGALDSSAKDTLGHVTVMGLSTLSSFFKSYKENVQKAIKNKRSEIRKAPIVLGDAAIPCIVFIKGSVDPVNGKITVLHPGSSVFDIEYDGTKPNEKKKYSGISISKLCIGDQTNPGMRAKELCAQAQTGGKRDAKNNVADKPNDFITLCE